jgi:hypothetical protein
MALHRPGFVPGTSRVGGLTSSAYLSGMDTGEENINSLYTVFKNELFICLYRCFKVTIADVTFKVIVR